MTEKVETLVKTLADDVTELQNMLDNHATRENVKLLLVTWIEKLNLEKNN